MRVFFFKFDLYEKKIIKVILFVLGVDKYMWIDCLNFILFN